MSLLLLLLASIKGGSWFHGRAAHAPAEVKDVSFARIAFSDWQAPSSFNALAVLLAIAFLPSPGAARLPPAIRPSETKELLERRSLHPRLRYLCQSANCQGGPTQAAAWSEGPYCRTTKSFSRESTLSLARQSPRQLRSQPRDTSVGCS